MKVNCGKIKKWFRIIITVLIVGTIMVLGINGGVIVAARNRILTEEQAQELDDVDCILVLGAGIWDGDEPSPMLADRLSEGLTLYQLGIAKKLLMSGDHGTEEYDEVNVMKEYAIRNKVPSEDVFMDHAGFSTYDSMYRAKEVFQAKKVVIVTQKYHLYRALYIAEQLGLEAYGVAADPRLYSGAVYRECREVLARNKDFLKCMSTPKSKYVGDPIPISGNGDVTNDK